ncbi:MAG TPA: extracellular solute-binding protein [Actinomycetota bacterium]|nr:extracellular solute-binding protein [Actinomycetota bacterium]
MRRWFVLLAVFAGLVPAFAAGCGGDDGDEAAGTDTATEGGEAVSGSVSVMSTWSGPEQETFQAVIDGFTEQNPDVDVRYDSAGDALPTVLSTAVEGGNPPTIAVLAQPGLIQGYADRGAIKPLDFAEDVISENFGESVVETGRFNDQLYSFLFKADNKSTVWYNVQAFESAGVEPPETWEDLQGAADTLSASGIPAWSFGAADGWVLTDFFENIYLRQAGADMYDQLAEHQIPWTDESVKEALRTMGEIFENKDNIAGNALQIDFPTSVSAVFSENPEAAMIAEGDFVPGVVESPLEPETGYNVFSFPSIDDSPPVVVGGGDTVSMFTDSEAAQALVEFLATPEAAEVWAQQGGFATLAKDVDPNIYPDEITRTTAGALSEAETFRFDLSDLQPAEFGGTVGQGLFKLFQDFYANPSDVDGIAQQMERAAARAYG